MSGIAGKVINGPWPNENDQEISSTPITINVPQGFRAEVTLIPDLNPVTSMPNYGKIKTKSPYRESGPNLLGAAYTGSRGTTAFGPNDTGAQEVKPVTKPMVTKALKFSFVMLFISVLLTGAFGMLLFIPASQYIDKFTAFIGTILGLTTSFVIAYEGVGKELGI